MSRPYPNWLLVLTLGGLGYFGYLYIAKRIAIQPNRDQHSSAFVVTASALRRSNNCTLLDNIVKAGVTWTLNREAEKAGEEAISSALYSPPVWKPFCEQIIIVGGLKIGNIPVGGTYVKNIVLIATERSDNQIPRAISSYYQMLTLYGELTSLIIRHDPSVIAIFKQLHVSDPAVYQSNGLSCVARGQAAINVEKSWFPQGLLTEYSACSPEEDINIMCGYLFLHNSDAEAACNSVDILRKKRQILQQWLAENGIVVNWAE